MLTKEGPWRNSPHALCRAGRASGADAAGNFNGRPVPTRPLPRGRLFLQHPPTPSIPFFFLPFFSLPCPRGPRSSVAEAAAAQRRMETQDFTSLPAPNPARIAAPTATWPLPFQEGSTPARGVLTGLADQTPCLHRLAKQKEGKKKRKSWVLLKILHCNPAPKQSSLSIPPKGGGLGSWGPRPGQEGWERFNPELPGGGRTCAHQRERPRRLNRNRHRSRCDSRRKPAERGSRSPAPSVVPR